MRLLMILATNLFITGLAYKRNSLNESGAVAACLLGSGIFILGDGFMWLILMSFFLSSSFLTSYTRRYKHCDDAIVEEKYRVGVTCKFWPTGVWV